MPKLATALLISLFVCALSGLASAKPVVWRTKDFKPLRAEWESFFGGINIPLVTPKGKPAGGIIFSFTDKKASPKSGKVYTLKDLSSVSYTDRSNDQKPNALGVSGESIKDSVKSFSAQLKPDGKVKFVIRLKREGWDVELDGDLPLKVGK